MTTRITIWTAIAAVPWLVGAAVHEQVRPTVWAIALGIEFVGFVTGWPIPRRGASRVNQWEFNGVHLVERYQQVFLIALGESILIIGLTSSANQLTTVAEVAAFLVAFALTVLLWRIYFHRAGHMLPETIRVAQSPGKLGESATYTHLVTVASVLTTAVGFELVIAHPTHRAEMPLAVVMLGGAALFLLAQSWAEREAFARLSVRRLAGALVLAVAVPIGALLPGLAVLAATAVVLVLVNTADTLETHRRPHGPIASDTATPSRRLRAVSQARNAWIASAAKRREAATRARVEAACRPALAVSMRMRSSRTTSARR
ncbi:low temperature requirement protein A [Micromonospora sp. M12]